MYHIRETVQTEIEIKKSRFIGILAPVNSEEEARSFLAAIRKKYPVTARMIRIKKRLSTKSCPISVRTISSSC